MNIKLLCWVVLLSAFTSAQTRTITHTNCTAKKLGVSIAIAAIGEPVAAVTLSAPVWNPAKAGVTAHCSVEGSMTPVEKGTTAQSIHFRVLLPES